MQQETCPATSNIQELITRLQSELTANQIKFILLRLIKVFMSGPEIRARIGQRLPKPQLVKLKRLVIVMSNGRAVPVPGMSSSIMEKPSDSLCRCHDALKYGPTNRCGASENVFSNRKYRENIACNIEIAPNEGLSKENLVWILKKQF
jgi:hypothetical protein